MAAMKWRSDGTLEVMTRKGRYCTEIINDQLWILKYNSKDCSYGIGSIPLENEFGSITESKQKTEVAVLSFVTEFEMTEAVA